MLRLMWTEVADMWRQDRAVMLARVHTPFSSVAMVRLTAAATAQSLHPEGVALGIMAGSTKRLAGGGINTVCAIELPESVRVMGAAMAVRMMTRYARAMELAARMVESGTP